MISNIHLIIADQEEGEGEGGEGRRQGEGRQQRREGEGGGVGDVVLRGDGTKTCCEKMISSAHWNMY